MTISNGIITLADARASIYGNPAPAGVTANDDDISRYVEAATPVIERLAGPVVSASRTYVFDGGLSAYPLPVAFRTVTSVTVSGTVTTNYVADAAAGIIYPGTTAGASVFGAGLQNVSIVVVVGYASSADYPANVVLATRELVRLWWQQGRQANRPGTAEQDPGAAPMGFAVPKRVVELLLATPNVGGFA